MKLPSQIPKLIVMLSSSADGEVLAAARAIGRTLDGAGLSFHDLAEAVDLPVRRVPNPIPAQSWQAPHRRTNPDGDRVAWCLQQGVDSLPYKDRQFLADLSVRLNRWGGNLTPAQQAWLLDICNKIEARAA